MDDFTAVFTRTLTSPTSGTDSILEDTFWSGKGCLSSSPLQRRHPPDQP